MKRYLQGSHPDRLLTALRRSVGAGRLRPAAVEQAIGKVASEIARLQSAGAGSIGVLSGASLTTEKPTCSASSRACLKTPFIDYNGRLCMVSAGAASKKRSASIGSPIPGPT